MAQGGQGQQGGSDSTSNLFWILAALVVGAMSLWYFKKDWIVSVAFHIRHAEMMLIVPMVKVWAQLMVWFHLPAPSLQPIYNWEKFIQGSSYADVTFQRVIEMSQLVGSYLRFLVLPPLVIMCAYLLFFHKAAQFRKQYTMKSLRRSEARNWPVITPVLDLDLTSTSIDKGPWAMAQPPLKFAKEKNILTLVTVQGKLQHSIDSALAQQQFIMQMGPRWRGAEALPIHMKALLVIFAARAEKERDLPKKLIAQIAASAQKNGKLDFSGVSQALKKYGRSRSIEWLSGRHAYVYTLMASLMEFARTDGVVASAEFLWLKPVDRRLWYMINSVGRQTAVVEVAGPFAHWLAEKTIKRALKTPMVEQAVTAMDGAVQSILHIPESELWQNTRNAD
jgi:intracellular multiplication protein IcmP